MWKYVVCMRLLRKKKILCVKSVFEILDPIGEY